MTAHEIIERIKGRRISERAVAKFVYQNFEPRPMQKEAIAFSRFILSRLKAGIDPIRIPELWCFQCWSADTECVCLELAKATPDKPEQAEKTTEEQIRRKKWQEHAAFIREHGYSAWLRLIEGRMKVN